MRTHYKAAQCTFITLDFGQIRGALQAFWDKNIACTVHEEARGEAFRSVETFCLSKEECGNILSKESDAVRADHTAS